MMDDGPDTGAGLGGHGDHRQFVLLCGNKLWHENGLLSRRKFPR